MGWVKRQYDDVKGNLKYGILSEAIRALLGAGAIAGLVAFLHRAFRGIDGEEFVFLGVFLFTFITFLIFERQPRRGGRANAPSVRKHLLSPFPPHTCILFPWVVTTNDGNLDTALAVCNTTSDPALIGTLNQSGIVTLYFFPAGGGTAPAPTTLNGGNALPGGQTATYVLSSLGSPFKGYIIAVCNFQFGYGFVTINNPSGGSHGHSQCYLGVKITDAWGERLWD